MKQKQSQDEELCRVEQLLNLAIDEVENIHILIQYTHIERREATSTDILVRLFFTNY